MPAISQWNLRLVKAEEAYNLLQQHQDSSVVNWHDIQVGHIDTGVRRHPVFGPWVNSRSDTLLLEDGVNYKERGKLPLDPMNYKRQVDELKINPGHGTRTASVLCGYEPGEYRGVAPGLPVIPYRAVNGVDLTTSRTKRVARALSHAVRDSLCEVVSISLGHAFGAAALKKALIEAYESGTIVVAAAGQPANTVMFPARYAGTISVGGVNEKREIYNPYSEEETRYVDVWAPADSVRVATSSRKTDGEQGFTHKYIDEDGTSYATAHVAAAAAMWLCYRYEELERDFYPEPWQRIEAFRRIILKNGTAMAGANPPRENTRILDIERVLKADLPEPNDLEKQFNVPRIPDPPSAGDRR